MPFTHRVTNFVWKYYLLMMRSCFCFDIYFTITVYSTVLGRDKDLFPSRQQAVVLRAKVPGKIDRKKDIQIDTLPHNDIASSSQEQIGMKRLNKFYFLHMFFYIHSSYLNKYSICKACMKTLCKYAIMHTAKLLIFVTNVKIKYG